MGRVFTLILACIWLAAAGALAAERELNASISRLVTGEYAYRSIKEQRLRGRESWTLTVHPDGSRSMMSFVDNFDAGVQYNAVERVTASFRPLECFVVHWVGGQRRASAFYTVNGDRLNYSVITDKGLDTGEIVVPEAFSLQSHPVAYDGWRGYWYDKSRRGVQSGKNVNLSVAPDSPTPLRGTLSDEDAEWIGVEKIAVPAGTFEAEHYKFRGGADVWILLPDRIIVKYAYQATDREYVLTAFKSMPK